MLTGERLVHALYYYVVPMHPVLHITSFLARLSTDRKEGLVPTLYLVECQSLVLRTITHAGVDEIWLQTSVQAFSTITTSPWQIMLKTLPF